MKYEKTYNFIANLGHHAIGFIIKLGQTALFLIDALFLPKQKIRGGFRRLLAQIYNVGFLSLIIIVVSGIFIGMVLGLQGYNILVRYGSEGAVGQMIALSLVRELGPVVSALLFAGRAGSALTAEIGIMKATDQLSSMEVIGASPLKLIIAPRFWAGVISMPILSVIFNVVGIFGGAVVCIHWLGVYDGSFWSGIQQYVDLKGDIGNGILKSLVFGFVVTWISLFQGYYSTPTSEGIGRATTRAVVYSSLAVLGIDFILTAVMFGDL